jgi:molybdate transport system substrate-binding protein
MATRHVLAELITGFESTSRHRVALESVGGVDAAKRVRAGEAFDAVVLAREVIDDLIAAGFLNGPRIDIASSGIAVAVRAGSPHPDISSPEAVQRAVLAARTVGYSTGPSGSYLAQLFTRWDPGEEMKRRIVIAPPGVPVGSLVAAGDVELGFQQLSELISLSGIEVVGLLPAGIQLTTTFSGGVACTSTQPDATRSLLEFMAGPDVIEVKRRQGMEAG